jgi:hypothetical protein
LGKKRTREAVGISVERAPWKFSLQHQVHQKTYFRPHPSLWSEPVFKVQILCKRNAKKSGLDRYPCKMLKLFFFILLQIFKFLFCGTGHWMQGLLELCLQHFLLFGLIFRWSLTLLDQQRLDHNPSISSSLIAEIISVCHYAQLFWNFFR